MLIFRLKEPHFGAMLNFSPERTDLEAMLNNFGRKKFLLFEEVFLFAGMLSLLDHVEFLF